MASPFQIFRKYQKSLLVVAGVVLMFVFVVGDSLMGLIGPSSGGGGDPSRDAKAVAVSWNDGKLTNEQLSMLVFKRRLVNEFLASVEYFGQRAVQESGGELRPLNVAMISGPDEPHEGVERDVVRTMIFAEAGRGVGMSVSDDDIVQYLDAVGRNRVSRDQMRAIASQLSVGDRGAPINFVMDALRDEMLARNYIMGYHFALQTVLPEERWQDWLRVNDRVVVEAAAIPVSSFVIDVPDPTDAELAEYFDQYKNREPQPDYLLNTELPSRWPGFAVPRTVDVQFVRAEFDKFVDKLEDTISEEEIKKFYEDNKDPHFIRADSTISGAEGGSPAGAATETPAIDLPATEPPGAGADADKPAERGTTAPAAEDGSSHRRSNGHGEFQLTAFQQDAAADAATAAPEDAAEATTDAALDTGTAPGAPATGTAAAEPSAGGQPAAAPADDKQPVVYQPLEEVRDVIRRQLAELKVNDELKKLMDKLEDELGAAYSSYFDKVMKAEADEQPAPAPPAELANLAPLAEQHGLEVDNTGQVSILELRDLPIGKSATADENNYRFVLLAFSPELELYKPVATFDIDGNRYLAIKTSDTPGEVPTLAKVRDQAVQAWKMQKAADLALKHAEELAKKAQQSGSWLADYFVDDKNIEVVRTDPFSWLTVGNISPRTNQVVSFRMSQPEGIVAPGIDFMRKAFQLEGTEVGAALNHDHTIAYVLRQVEHLNTQDQLRQSFLAEANDWYGLPVMMRDHRDESSQLLVEDILTAAGVQWQRPPDQQPQSEE